ncbi:hypothetical protein V1509DRAFT_566485 [Lipomyces kononenkoae]
MHLEAGGTIDKRYNWLEIVNRAKGYIVNTIVSGTSSENIVSTVTSVFAIADNVFNWITYAICDTNCFYYKPDDETFQYCLYKYTKGGNSCSMAGSQDLKQIVTDLLSYTLSTDEVGACATIFNLGSTVVYIKWRRAGSGLGFDNIWCERVIGWGAPNPYSSSSSLSPGGT